MSESSYNLPATAGPKDVASNAAGLPVKWAAHLRRGQDTEKPRSNVRRPIIVGSLAALFLFGGFGVWAGTVPLSSAIVAPGVVKVHSKRRAVQHLDGGILKELFVREGDQVEKDQLLARLDTTIVEAELGSLETRLFGNLAQEARLAAEQRNADAIQFPEELLKQIDRPEVRTAVETQKAEFAARAASLAGRRQVIEQQIAQFTDSIRGIESNTEGLKQQIGYIREQIQDTDFLFEKGLARKPMLLALKRTEAELDAQIARNKFSAAQAQGKIAELLDTRRQLLYDRDTDIAKSTAAVREETLSLRHRITATRDKLARTEIRAPEAGVVLGLSTRDINAVLAPRETLLEIVPDSSRLAIEVFVKPTDREDIRVGQPSRIRITALNARRTPMLPGRVAMISPDAVADAKNNPALSNPNSLQNNAQASILAPAYKAEIVLDDDKATAQFLFLLKPGMPVVAFIETGERTFAEYMIQPVVMGVGRAFKER